MSKVDLAKYRMGKARGIEKEVYCKQEEIICQPVVIKTQKLYRKSSKGQEQWIK